MKKVTLIASILLVAVLIIAAVIISKHKKVVKINGLIDLGEKYLSEFKYEEAVLAFETVIDIDSSEKRAYNGRARAIQGWGDALTEDKDYESAIGIYLRLWDEDQKYVYERIIQAYLQWAESYVLEEDYNNAIFVLTEGLELTKDDRLSYQITIVQEKKRAFEDSQELLSKLLPFAGLSEMIMEYSESGIDYGIGPVSGRTYTERREVYAPMIELLEKYIDFLGSNPNSIEALTDKVQWTGEGVSKKMVSISGYDFPVIGYAYYLLQGCYRNCGDWDNTRRVRRDMIAWCYGCNENILSEHSDGRGTEFDGYGRIFKTDDQTYTYNENGVRINGIMEDGSTYTDDYIFDDGRFSRRIFNSKFSHYTEVITYNGDYAHEECYLSDGTRTQSVGDMHIDKFGRFGK